MATGDTHVVNYVSRHIRLHGVRKRNTFGRH